ncbi:PIN domain-containing protein [Glaciihabitans sp. UYNi722]|uniref:PIN domain-containing protein n=1 Tax=Glaciihabitans sp. UYNi722 TaxID=3156344 RepID=UPI00339407D8
MIMLDTSVLIDFPDEDEWPEDEMFACSAVTLAELQFGLQLTVGTPKHAARQARLTLLESQFEWTPFDEKAAVGYGSLAAVVHQGRATHARSKDIMIAGHAYSMGAALMTRNPKGFELVAKMITIIPV